MVNPVRGPVFRPKETIHTKVLVLASTFLFNYLPRSSIAGLGICSFAQCSFVHFAQIK